MLGSSRPDYRWLIVGAQRSGSTFHQVQCFCSQTFLHNVAAAPSGVSLTRLTSKCLLTHPPALSGITMCSVMLNKSS